MSHAQELIGSVQEALARASRALHADPEFAAQQAHEILKVVPDYPAAVLVLGIAHRMSGNPMAALSVLEPLALSQQSSAATQYELGLALGQIGRHDAAVSALRRALSLKPGLLDGWRALGDELLAAGDSEGADAAYAQHLRASTHDPRLLNAAEALCGNEIPRAELLLREHLKQFPTDVAAIRMFAEVAGRLGRYHDAESLLQRCLELSPGFHAARHNYALVLHRQNKSLAALDQIERLTAIEPRKVTYRNLKAAILARIGEYTESIDMYAESLRAHPLQPAIWLSYGHALATAGYEQESIAAYRKCINLAKHFGEAYWSLANLKTFRFTATDRQQMLAQVARALLNEEDRFHFHFALGKAFEDSCSYAESFAHYQTGNRLRRAGLAYNADDTSTHVRRCKASLTRQLFRARHDWGTPNPDPIFIVGLPRAGSTLIEQILATHSAVEGTMELPDIISLARRLSGKKISSESSRYPDVLAELSAEQCRALGEEYLQRTRIQRKTDRSFFIDKMPNNFLHIGLIQLALPNAKIIDARRHPMACCFSGFKQHFARGQNFTYSLEDIGRYYHDYVELMAHFDDVLPDRIHRVFYENMIDDTELEIRRLLVYCGLPFETGCLRFYENDRAVRTASSQQVRQPIFRDGLDHWRHFEDWLEPLKTALGAALETYPGFRSISNCGSVQ